MPVRSTVSATGSSSPSPEVGLVRRPAEEQAVLGREGPFWRGASARNCRTEVGKGVLYAACPRAMHELTLAHAVEVPAFLAG